MRPLLAFLAGGAFFVALQELAGPLPAVLVAGAIALTVIVGEAWQTATDAARSIEDRETAHDRWLQWHWHDVVPFVVRGRRG
jgi:hypothetical protein